MLPGILEFYMTYGLTSSIIYFQAWSMLFLILSLSFILILNSSCAEYDDVEEILRQFDMNMAYGPCLGITRLERFERSSRLGLNPPMDVKNLLERVGGNPDALWEGRV